MKEIWGDTLVSLCAGVAVFMVVVGLVPIIPEITVGGCFPYQYLNDLMTWGAYCGMPTSVICFVKLRMDSHE